MSYNVNKNPWGSKPGGGGAGGTQIPSLNHAGMVPFQQQPPVFQNMGMNPQNLGINLQQMATNQMNLATNPIFQQQLQAVSYSGNRGLNPTAFQGNVPSNPGGTKQKVFTGSVTQIHDNFGFIDDEVFFSRNVCVKGSNPVVGDRVLAEATFNTSMPFKWNATRVQVLAGGNSRDRGPQADPVRRNDSPRDFGRDNRGRVAERRNRSRDRDDDESDRKRRREENRPRERDDKDRKSPLRRRSRSPKVRRRMRHVQRYNVQIPKMSLNLAQGDLLDIKKRYTNLYIPSDFFHTINSWVDTFPVDKPFALTKPCSFHLMYKEHDPVTDNGAIFEPADADYTFSAKVMLMGIPNIEDIYQKCCSLANDRESRDRDSEDRDYIHPTRLINFLIGMKAKNETMAIGGPWSPSLDGANPEKDPSVLIKTAIRTCKALTGIDLSNCTKWYRFVELYYRRGESTHKGKAIPARVETVVIFLPDLWSCLPTRVEWEQMQQNYRKQLEKILKADSGEAVDDLDEAEPVSDEKKEEDPVEIPVPTHHSQLNPKNMTVPALRDELIARNIDSKGLKNQLVARLTKAIKAEAETEEEESTKEEPKKDPEGVKNKEVEKEKDKDDTNSEKDRKSEVGDKKLDDVQKRRIEKQYTLPDQPSLIVHPSKTAKSGKFDCVSMSLSLLLDYRPDDAKEHAFEVYLFAELFNEMLMRDFGFNIFKALCQLPDKPKEEDRKKKDVDDKKEKKEGEKDENVKAETSSESKKDDKDKDGKERENDKKKDREIRRSDKKSDSSDDEDDDSRSRRKRRERVKLVTKDKHLLLSFVYFDQSYSGYIFEQDLEELLYCLGLELSRSQVKKLLSKALTRDSLHYRQLTDKPKDEDNDKEKIDGSEEIAETQADIQEIIKGNKSLLPVFQYGQKPSANGVAKSDSSNSNDGLVLFQGAVVDIGKLLSQLDRSEKARIETERCLDEIKSESQKLSDKYSKSSSIIKHLNSEVKEYKEKLRNTEDALGRSNAHSKLFQTTLMDIRDKIEPVLKTASHKEDKKDRDRDGDKKKERDDGKSRWEKERDSSRKEDKDKKEEVKKEPKDKDVKTDVKKEETGVKVEENDVEMNEESK
ncbi:cell division cycle and apoptosis regulator protein 1-like [Anthonomus grandis grandis]|uniref:cell division cycle and apoptosis regulator protein 1-like n=1 Tax=Anthonomus grandis grandis TaxID=2921223 RepID=UPI00216572FD|nr:cell division cycle and apoptosis regulator protein 1-like [Anthonomus grandis grandis]